MAVNLTNLSPQARTIIFYGAFAFIYAVYLVVVGGLFLGYASLSGAAMEAIVQYAPETLSQVSLSGELVAVLLGGVLAWTAPGRPSLFRFFLLLALSGIAWLMYLHMQALISNDVVGEVLLAGNTTPEQLPESLKTLSSFAATARGFAAATFGAVIGWNFNQTIPIAQHNAPTAPAGTQ